MNALVVCHGNICRSPIAAGILRRLYAERGIRGEVESAGVWDDHVGQPADPRAISVAKTHGIDITSHRARAFVADDAKRFDALFAVERDVERHMRGSVSGLFAGKIHRLRPSRSDEPEADIPDPYYGAEADFERVFQLMSTDCQRVAGELLPGFLLEPLSDSTLDRAIELLRLVFPRQPLLHNASAALRLSLKPDAAVARAAFWVAGVVRPRYWVLVESSSRRVVGVTGAYEEHADEADALWGGWTCVHPDYRNRGLGLALIHVVGTHALRSGKRFLRLYGSTAPEQERAQRLFERLDAKVVRTSSFFLSKDRKVFREYPLQ